ncbi:MAG: carboxypeptidase-like regulatory domain-containing protein [Flavobacterium sp.]
MKYKLLIVCYLFLFQIAFSQTGRTVHGKVTNNENPISGTEVINLTTKNITHTDRNGRFSIIANARDVLAFVSQNYETKKVYLGQSSSDKTDFSVVLTQKNEQLKEVVVTSQTKPKFDSQKIVDGKNFDDSQSSPKNRLIYDGTIENGTDFVRIYKDIVKAFRKNKEENSAAKIVPFKTLILNNYDTEFFAKSLDLKQNEIVPFLTFCEADPKSKDIKEDSNTLFVMDFLMAKNAEFKKTLQ